MIGTKETIPQTCPWSHFSAVCCAVLTHRRFAEASHLATVAHLCERAAQQSQAMTCWATCLLIASTTGCIGLAAQAHGGMGVSAGMQSRAGAVAAIGHHVQRYQICKTIKNLTGEVIALCDRADACYLVALGMSGEGEDDSVSGGLFAAPDAPIAAPGRASVMSTVSQYTTVDCGPLPPPLQFPPGYYVLHRPPSEQSVVPFVVSMNTDVGALGTTPRRPCRPGSSISRAGRAHRRRESVSSVVSGTSSRSGETGIDCGPTLIVRDETSRDLLQRALDMYVG